MVIVELIGSLSIAIAFVSAITLTIIHIKYKQHDVVYIHDYPMNPIEQSLSVLPFQEFNQSISTVPSTINKELPIINVINNDEIFSSPIKYGIQWTFETEEDSQSVINNSLSNVLEIEQVDSLSFGDQSVNIRSIQKEKIIHSIDSDLTNYDNPTIQTDLNQNHQKVSHHSSISNLDVTIPSNLSSSIDLEQFESISTTSNISELLNTI